LGTRRLRLYVVAYLRGLLKPYYEQGNLSIIREEVILNALSVEFDAEASKQVHLVQASLAQNVKDKAGFYDKLFNKILEFRHKLELTSAYVEESSEDTKWTDDPAMNSLINKFKSLQETGEWEELVKSTEEHHAIGLSKAKERLNNPYLFDDPKNPKLQWSFGQSSEDNDKEEKDSVNPEDGVE